MNYLLYWRNKIKEKDGFSLLEIMIVLTISSLLTVIFMQLIIELYHNNEFFCLENNWQLDAYLVIDFIAAQINNSVEVEIINENEIDIFTYYDQKYQWLKFNIYQSKGQINLGRTIGSSELDLKDFGKNLSLFDKIENLSFKTVEPGLLKISLTIQGEIKEKDKKLTVSRLVKI